MIGQSARWLVRARQRPAETDQDDVGPSFAFFGPAAMIYRVNDFAAAEHARQGGARASVTSKNGWMVLAMLLAVALTAVLAYWDEQRESAAALEDFAQEQATLASSLAAELDTRLSEARRDALIAAEAKASARPIPASVVERYGAVRIEPQGSAARASSEGALQVSVPTADGGRIELATSVRDLLSRSGAIERPNALQLMLLPPASSRFHTTSGRLLTSRPLMHALGQGKAWLRLQPTQAADLGLPKRTALAGLAQIDAGPLGRWGIVAVASARRERDREQRAQWRLVLAVVFAGGLVLAFGGMALRTQRKELALVHELAIANLQRHRDERLERASKAAIMGTLAMGIAHEVSTPLGVIAGRAEQLLAKLGQDERATRSLRAILEQTDRINQIIRALLGLARGASPSARSIEPPAIVEGAVTLVEHRFAEANVALLTDMPKDLPEVHGDLHLLQHALVNLLLNACEACAPGAQVEVQVRATSSALALVVNDDGEGISPSTAALATEPFFTTKGQGTGLGLAIANEIVKSHGGSLRITARTPRGTHACIELPLANRASHEAA
jgi:two-component system NtrC family sensor kinase